MDRKDTNKRTADKALAHMQLIFFSEPIMKKYINRLIPGVFFFFLSWENIGDWGVKNKEE